MDLVGESFHTHTLGIQRTLGSAGVYQYVFGQGAYDGAFGRNHGQGARNHGEDPHSVFGDDPHEQHPGDRRHDQYLPRDFLPVGIKVHAQDRGQESRK